MLCTFAKSLHKTGRFSGIWSTCIILENSAFGRTELILNLNIFDVDIWLFLILNILNALGNNATSDMANIENTEEMNFISRQVKTS